MGLFSKIIGVAAPIVGGVFGGPAGAAIGSAIGGAVAGKSSGGGQVSSTTQQQMDPRNAGILYGNGTPGNPGLLSQYQSYMNQPQNSNNAAFGGAAQQFLGGQGGGILSQLQGGATNLLNSNYAAPHASAQGTNIPAAMQASQVQAPGQNNMDLTGAYDRVINGNAGANPYLTSALQAGVDQTNTSFMKNQTDLTNNLQRNILPGISSNAVLAGQYGGTRQGIAQGNAISDFTNQLNSSNTAIGQANSANTLGAQAQAFNQGQDRSLAALQGLSAQQYGVASQNAAQAQAARTQNQNVELNATQFNAGQQQNSNQFNASLQGQTNALNSNNQQAGLAGLSGVLGSAYGYAQNQENQGINRATQVNGLLAPYLGMGGSTTSSQQLPNNTGANILGGATAGLGLFNTAKNSGFFDGWGSSTPSAQNIMPWSG